MRVSLNPSQLLDIELSELSLKFDSSGISMVHLAAPAIQSGTQRFPYRTKHRSIFTSYRFGRHGHIPCVLRHTLHLDFFRQSERYQCILLARGPH